MYVRVSPPELLKAILRQELEQHARRKVGLLLLVAAIAHIRQIEPDLLDVSKALVVRVEEGGEAGVIGRAEIERDVAVERLDRELVKLLVDKADIFEIGRSQDLCARRVSLAVGGVMSGGPYVVNDGCLDLREQIVERLLHFRHGRTEV